MNSPRCEDMEVCWNSKPTRAFPEKTRCVYDGDTVHLFHWFDETPTGEVTIKLNLPDGSAVSNAIALQMSEKNNDMARVAAATIIRNVVDAEVGAKLALDYQLMSKWTNYLVTEQSDNCENELPLPELRKVRSQLSAGWGGSSTLQMMERRSTVVECREPASFYRRATRDCIERSDECVSFLFEDDTGPHDDLIARIKQIIASASDDLLNPLTLADLQLDGSIESAIRQLIDDGLDESLIVIVFLHYFVLGKGDDSFDRSEARAIRKLYRAELVKAGVDPAETGQRIVNAFAGLDDWEDVVGAGFGLAA